MNVSDRRFGAAVLAALGSMTSVQLGAALSKPLFATLGPAGVVVLRLLFAALVLSVAVRPRLRGRPASELWVPVALGTVTGLMTLSFYEAISRIPLGIAVAIEFCGPLGVALAGSRRWLDALWVALAAGGICLLTLGHPVSGTLDTTGVLLAFCAAAGWGTYIVLTKRVGQSWAGFEGLAVSLSVAALVTVPFCLVSDFPHRFHDPGAVVAGLALGLLVPLLPYMLEFWALRRLPTRVFGVLMSIEPGIGALLGFLILGQSLALAGVVAVAMIVAASVGVTLSAAREQTPIPLLVD